MPVSMLSVPRLKIGGQDANASVYAALIGFEVDDSLLMPAMFSLRLLDQGFSLVDSDTFALGTEIELSIETTSQDGQNVSGLLIKGEITAVEPEFADVANPVTVVRGYDKSHRFYRDKKTRTFTRVKDSDIASLIAGEYGLTADVAQTSGTYDYVCQSNQTDMEFLRGRAWLANRFLYVQDGTLHFVTTPAGETEIPLQWGTTLTDFRARLTSAEQASKVVVRAWDPMQKQRLMGEATAPRQAPSSNGNYGGKAAEKAFKAATRVIVDSAVGTQDQAQALAQSVCEEINGAYIQAEGTCPGTPGLRAGVMVNLSGVGQRFSGQYRVSRSIHCYNEDGHYETRFEINGRRTNTLGELMTGGTHGAYGVIVGVVTNNNDPDNLGRVKVKFANWMNDAAEVESDWVRVAVPMAGGGRGFEFLPEVNDEVLLAFEYDNVQHPFVIGGLWNKTDSPPSTSSDIVGNTGKVQKRIIKSRAGHVITLDDTDNQEKVSVVDKTGKNSFEIDSKNNAVTIKAEAKIEVQTKGGHKVLIDDHGTKIEIVSGGNSVKLESSAVTVESAAQLVLKGQTIKIEGTTVSIKGQASVEVEGGMSTVKGSGVLTLQGGLVKIN